MREKEPATRVIFVRHGATDFPKDRIYCDDREDPPLNDRGREHAREAAQLLASAQVEVIYSSPMARTRGTAAAIAHATGAAVTNADDLRERRFGDWEGLYFHEIEQRYPEDYARWKRDPAVYTPAGGESIHDLLRRVGDAVAAIVARHPGKTAVVVSHVGPIRVAVCAAVRLPVEEYRRLIIDYGSLTALDYGKNQNNLIYLNYTRRR